MPRLEVHKYEADAVLHAWMLSLLNPIVIKHLGTQAFLLLSAYGVIQDSYCYLPTLPLGFRIPAPDGPRP